jgi:cell division protein FtsB
MADFAALAELDARIATLRENIRDLTEQAAAASGAARETLLADRIADQEAKLTALLEEREALGK